MNAEPEPQTDTVSSIVRPGKDEMNFAEFPIALLTDRAPKGQKTIKFEDKIYDEKKKKLVTRRRIIEGSQEYGLPTATDDAVILALIQLTKQKSNFTKRDVEFSRLELIKMLGWPNEGKNYDRIKLSLLRIANVTYNYDNAWWDSRQKTWTTKAFHIIDTVEINDSRASTGQGGLFPSRVVWGDVVFDSFQSGFLRSIDFELCMKLQYPTALRMYRFLGKRFHLKPEWTFDLKEFAYEHIGLGRNYEGGTQIARKLRPAILELEEVGFLEPLGEEMRFPKEGRDWKIRFLHRAPALSLPLGTPLALTSASPPPLVAELVERGVTKSTAVELIEAHGVELIQAKLDVFDWMVGKNDKRITKNPAGYLVKSIQNDYATPKGFVPKAERQRLEEERQAKERAAAETRRLERENEARERAEWAAIKAYWDSLTPEQQAELQARMDAEADPDTLKQENGPFKETMRKLRREEYIRHMLRAQKPEAVAE